VLYALPFLFTAKLWWLIFFFPIPLLYVVRTENLSFVHGYVWGVIAFALHFSGIVCVVAAMAGKAWWVGCLLGLILVLYQALSVGLLFLCATKIVQYGKIRSVIIRLLVWTGALLVFIVWTDWYSLWIFGIKEGYPLMHPLLPLAVHPQLLALLPIVGKIVMLMLLLLCPMSFVVLLWEKNGTACVVWLLSCLPWIICWFCVIPEMHKPLWLKAIKTIPYMAHSTGDNPLCMMKIAARELRTVITHYPAATIIIMPESAFNCTVLSQSPELLRLWGEEYLGKAVHIIFGSFRWHADNYYNALHWVYNGKLKQCFDKKHAMLISERLGWLNWFSAVQATYFDGAPLTTIATNERILLCLSDEFSCVPYICSELFFNEYPDDIYGDVPIIALVNDTPFLRWYASYIRQILLLMARLKAIQWQRDIVYVSYTRSLYINTHGMSAEINEFTPTSLH